MGTALVFGGSTGIGRGIAQAWAATGHDVITVNRSRPVGPGGDSLGFVHLDLRNPAEAAGIMRDVVPEDLVAVCYSAVYFTGGRAAFGDVTEADWIDQCNINVHGLWLALRATLPALRRGRPGLFLGVSSEVVYNAGPHRSGYAATKAAARGLLESVAAEEHPDGVRFVQTLPAEMVDSPGIRARRPADFDYSDYMVGADFAPFARDLLLARGDGFDGEVVVVGKGGGYRLMGDAAPRSQSRPLGVVG